MIKKLAPLTSFAMAFQFACPLNIQAEVFSSVSDGALFISSDIEVAGVGDTIEVACDSNGNALVNSLSPDTGAVKCSQLNALEVFGGAGNDVINISRFNRKNIEPVVDGGAGDDQITGSNKSDIIFGDLGNDTIDGRSGSDNILGDEGDDIIDGKSGKDTINGGEGNDTIRGGNGKDTLRGDAGDDTLLGENGKDSIDGGEGTDTLTDQKGRNTCTNGEVVSCK